MGESHQCDLSICRRFAGSSHCVPPLDTASPAHFYYLS